MGSWTRLLTNIWHKFKNLKTQWLCGNERKYHLRGAGYLAVNESLCWSLAFFPSRENKTTQIKQKGKEEQWLKMQLLFLVPIVTGYLTTRETQAQHSSISHCETWQTYQSCTVWNIDFNCPFGHQLAAELLKGQLRQAVFKLKAHVTRWKEDTQLGKKKKIRHECGDIRI